MMPEAARLAAALPPLKAPPYGARPAAGGGEARLLRAGSGQDFWQYRPYDRGDASRQIDWRRSGRSDALYIRETERLQPVTLALLRDDSETFAYGDKAAKSLLLLQTIALKALEVHARLILPPQPAQRYPSFAALAEAFRHYTPSSAATDADGVLMISDLLTDPAPWATHPARRKVVIQLFHTDEETFPFAGHVVFTGRHQESLFEARRAGALQEIYRQRWRQTVTAATTALEHQGWRVLPWRTDQPPLPLLRAVMLAL